MMSLLDTTQITAARERASDIRKFIETELISLERDPRNGAHGPDPRLVKEIRELARKQGLMTPHYDNDCNPVSHRAAAILLRAAGWSLLGPVAMNVMAPDEGNMNLIAKVGRADQRDRFLGPLIEGRIRSAFLMTEPSWEDGAGSDPSMLQTVARRDSEGWLIHGRKAFITGIDGAEAAIIMCRTDGGATMFLVELPDEAIRIERIIDTIDRSMPGGHAVVAIEGLRVRPEHVLGEVDAGFQYAQVRLAPARLTHCMRWLGACDRAHAVAVDYACQRQAFGKPLIEHEGVGFQLADNVIDLKNCELMIDWCASILDDGKSGTLESSMTKVFVSEALFRVADRCVQVMGGLGVSSDTIVERVFRETRAFRIYDGPTEVHRWSIAKRLQRGHLNSV
jgi:acyl-CoA dehydrogenase